MQARSQHEKGLENDCKHVNKHGLTRSADHAQTVWRAWETILMDRRGTDVPSIENGSEIPRKATEIIRNSHTHPAEVRNRAEEPETGEAWKFLGCVRNAQALLQHFNRHENDCKKSRRRQDSPE